MVPTTYMAAFIFERVHSDHLNGPWQGLSVRSNIVGISASQIRNLGERLPALPHYYQSHSSQLLSEPSFTAFGQLPAGYPQFSSLLGLLRVGDFIVCSCVLNCL